MATYVRMDIPGYYQRTALEDIQAQNPTWTPIETTTGFVENKYGTWLNKNIKGNWVFTDIAETWFIVEFDEKRDADQAIRDIGGRIIPGETSDAS